MKIIDKCKLRFDNKYDYSLVPEDATKKDIVKIICPVHNTIEQSLRTHLLKGCIYCRKGKTTNKHVLEHISDLKIIHSDKYEYTYDNTIVKWSQKSEITGYCKKHDKYFTNTIKSMKNYMNCPDCILEAYQVGYDKNRHSIENVIEECKAVHGDKYDYSFVNSENYVNKSTNVPINCPKLGHGIFYQKPSNHINKKHNCPVCDSENNCLTITEILEKANDIHNFKYEYIFDIDDKPFIKTSDKFIVVCPIHGEFPQLIKNHLYAGNGCPHCRESQGEKNIRIFLDKNKINYVRQKKYDDCKNIRPLPFDFYIERLNLCIEFDGIQHFKNTKYSEDLEFIQFKDAIKTKYCLDNNIDLLRIKYTDVKNVEKILTLIFFNFFQNS